jgi:DNA-directed RNA polymerase specialized sigma24 family protein
VLPPDAIRPIRGLTERAFRRLLDWLADGAPDAHGEAYLEMRQRLVLYFHRRNRPAPDELADETLNRIATTLETRGSIAITPPSRYSYIVARFVFLEDLRKQEHTHVPLDAQTADSLLTIGGRNRDPDPIAGLSEAERRFRCLEHCLDTLEPAQRSLIVEYYRGIGREKIELRRALAARLGITTNALGIRAGRIRETLVRCMDACDAESIDA